jgi:hypothetical protein
MFWLGYDHYSVQAGEIGSRHRHSDLDESLDIYFGEMRVALSEMSRVLRGSGLLGIVIGDSIYQGEHVDMGSKYIEMADSVGLEIVYLFHYDQRRYTSAFQRGLKTHPKRSHIMIFRKK